MMPPRDATQTTQAWIEACGITAADVVGRPTVEVYNEYGRWARREKALHGLWFTEFREDMRKLLGVQPVASGEYDRYDSERYSHINWRFEKVDK